VQKSSTTFISDTELHEMTGHAYLLKLT